VDENSKEVVTANTSEIKELMKDVPEKDIQDFVDETSIAVNNDDGAAIN